MEHIQRDYLRRLLRAVEKGERSPEHAADVIISLINENYDLKQDTPVKTTKKFHQAVQKALNSPWLYDNITDIKDEYYKQVRLFLNIRL